MGVKKKKRRLTIATSAASLALPTMLTGCYIQPMSGVTKSPPPVGTTPKRLPPVVSRQAPPPVGVAPGQPAAPVAAAQISETQAAGKFYDAGYSYCDAEVLGAFWSVSAYDAKVGLGRKMHEGGDPNWAMTPARSQAVQRHTNQEIVCGYENSGFSHNDVDMLAAFWGADSWSTKVKVSNHLSRGQMQLLRNAVAEARAAHGSQH